MGILVTIIQTLMIVVGCGYLAYLYHQDGVLSECKSDKEHFHMTALILTVIVIAFPLHFIFNDILSAIVVFLTLVVLLAVGFIAIFGAFVDMWTGQVGLFDMFDIEIDYVTKGLVTLAIIGLFVMLPSVVLGNILLFAGIISAFAFGLCLSDHMPVWAEKYLG